MRIGTPLSYASLIFALSCAAASAQQAPSSPSDRRTVLDVVVTSKSGQPVSGLQQQDFTILDNKAPEKVTGFAALGGPQAPVQVVLVIDTVNASPENLAIERAEVDKFFKANGGHLAYPTFLAILQETGIAMGESPTRNGNLLSAALAQINLGSGVQLKDTGASNDADRAHRSLVAAQRLVANQAAVPGRKLIIWLSPGWPLVSDPNYNYDDKQQQQLFHQAVVMSTLLRRAGVTFYTIKPGGTSEGTHQFDYEVFLKGAAKPIQAVPADTSLQVMSIQSGGLVLTGNNDLAGLMQQCVGDATSYYELSFDPPPGDKRDELQTLQIKMSQPGLTARTRTIYYSQP